MVKDSLVCWFPVNLNTGAVIYFYAEVNLTLSDCCQFVWSLLTEFIKLLSHIYEMRLNWIRTSCFSVWQPKYSQLDQKQNLNTPQVDIWVYKSGVELRVCIQRSPIELCTFRF